MKLHRTVLLTHSLFLWCMCVKYLQEICIFKQNMQSVVIVYQIVILHLSIVQAYMRVLLLLHGVGSEIVSYSRPMYVHYVYVFGIFSTVFFISLQFFLFSFFFAVCTPIQQHTSFGQYWSKMYVETRFGIGAISKPMFVTLG